MPLCICNEGTHNCVHVTKAHAAVCMELWQMQLCACNYGTCRCVHVTMAHAAVWQCVRVTMAHAAACMASARSPHRRRTPPGHGLTTHAHQVLDGGVPAAIFQSSLLVAHC